MTRSAAAHEDFSRKSAASSSSNRSFGIVMAVVFGLIGSWPLLGGGAPRGWSLAVAGAFAGFAIFFPAGLAPLNQIWFRFGLLLHRVVSPIILGILFFLNVTPMALVLRLLRKDLLRLRWEPEAKSYWIQRDPPGPEPQTMIHQF